MSKRFKTEGVDLALAQYKENPTPVNLDNLYNNLDSIITTVLSKVAHTFSKKNPDDYLDLSQNVRLSIYKILPRLAEISETGNQVVSIVVKASSWSFKTHYRRFKRFTPVKGYGLLIRKDETWTPDFNVPIEVPIENALGSQTSVSNSGFFDDPIMSSQWERHPREETLRYTNPNQLDAILLSSLPGIIVENAISKNRYDSKEPLIRFCLKSFIENRSPSTKVITKRWKESNPTYWIKYSSVLLRLSILEVIN